MFGFFYKEINQLVFKVVPRVVGPGLLILNACNVSAFRKIRKLEVKLHFRLGILLELDGLDIAEGHRLHILIPDSEAGLDFVCLTCVLVGGPNR